MLILFLKARAKWDTHTPDLFDAITQVHGYVRSDGTFVQPHSAHRMHAVEPHHVVDVANLSNNGGKPHKEPQMESNAVNIAPTEVLQPIGLPPGDAAMGLPKWVYHYSLDLPKS